MDNQIFELVNRRSDHQDKTLDEIKTLLHDHIKNDETYWRKIDIQDAQLSILRKILIGMGAIMTTILSAFWSWIHR